MKAAHIFSALLLTLALSSEAASERLLFRPPHEAVTNGTEVACFQISSHPTSSSNRYAEVHLSSATHAAWHHGERLRGTFCLSPGLPPARLMVFLKNRDGYWFQALLPERFQSGTNSWSVSFSPRAKDIWRPIGHHLVWNHRARLDPEFVGLRLFFEGNGPDASGSCDFLEAFLDIAPAASVPPSPSEVHLSSDAPNCFAMLEATFQLPDRYDNPFDPEEIDVSVEITRPDGKTNAIPAFYMQDFYAEENATGVALVPDGAPGWRVRYAPTVAGPHTMRIFATDSTGSATSAPVFFVARQSDGPAYIGISRKNRFRFQAGTNDFFPIGHNIRSPFDTRYDSQYPWKRRLPENYTVYSRYFERMAQAGENIAEIWMCQWSLGLEWSKASPGYHGAGDYHLGHAWQLDRVLEFARENNIRVNLVLNNHGRISLFSDEEWQDSPYNELNGGPIPKDDPIRFFTDPTAIKLQKRIYRYIVARWGWSPSVFAFELWSELDLCGSGKDKTRAHGNPNVIAWHREIATYIKSLDPNKHLISTHISNNYHNAKPEILKIPELDHCCIDAYHGSYTPLYIITLLKETAAFYHQFNKPVLVTEFGGSALGAGVSHISAELHAALWSSTCTTLGGAPFLWWWGLIDEHDLYHEFTAIRNFMKDAPYQDPALKPATLALLPDNGKKSIGKSKEDDKTPLLQVALSSGTNLIAWIYQPRRLTDRYYGEMATNAVPLERTVEWGPVTNGIYRVVQCDPRTGLPVKIHDYRTIGDASHEPRRDGKSEEPTGPSTISPGQGVLRFPLHPFLSDCAIKVTPR